jgi:hypothetical protein
MLAERQKGKQVNEKVLREVADLKDKNLKRAAELRKMYLREG